MQDNLRTKSGFTSFYVVIFASLLLTIIAVGFVSIIINATNQTLNEQLSAGAYNSALAGVEDAKLALMNCLASEEACGFLNQNSVSTDCNSVARSLGREFDATGGAIVAEGGVGDAAFEMAQSYTCVMVANKLVDYRSYLSATDSDSIRLVPLRAAADTDDIKSVKLSWYASEDSLDNVYDFRNVKNGKVYFGRFSDGLSMPPTISVQLLQTDDIFSLKSSELDYTVGNRSDRGTLFLVPTDNSSIALGDANSLPHIRNSATTGYANTNTADGFVKANDKSKQNNPYLVYCDNTGSSEFICNVIIDIPEPVQSSYDTGNRGLRNATTAFLVVSLPYGQPATDFAVQLCRDTDCHETIDFINAQYSIDSTGRANDVYRRVETRVEIADPYFPYPQYAVHLTGGGEVLKKNSWATFSGGYPSGCWYANAGVVQTCALTSTSGTLSEMFK